MRRTITVYDFEDDMAAGRKEANFSQGWGIAAFVTAMAVGAFVLAGTIKSRTYLPPTDPMAPSSERAAHAPAADHAAPAGEKGAAH
ncbi:MAG: hypothetical protein IPF98_23460 [Gemmatimonadetes bacterium]|nr:hypothetical protein [Gemmatimonadota bacterium]MCC6770868.1 hypothetical protein [Gemmatimonadaceae bacterium]